jgi:hypothetical protein
MRDFFQDFSYQYQRLEPVFFQLRTGLCPRGRTANEEILRDPGDEWLVNAEVGYSPMARLQLALKLDGL